MDAAVGLRTLGLLQNDPLRGPVALRLLESLITLPKDADAIGTATLVDGNALLSRTKLTPSDFGALRLRDDTTPAAARLSVLVGAPKGRAAVVQVGTTRELRPTGGDPTQNLGPFRARNYAAAIVGGPQSADLAAAVRDKLVAELPDFLRRCVAGKSEAEAFFLAVLARLHKKGVLDAAHDNGKALHEAVVDVDNSILSGVLSGTDDASPRQVTLTNGVDVLHVARGLPSGILTVEGLPEAVAAALSPSFVDSSTARERNRRYRGIFAVGALDVSFKAAAPTPAGTTLQVLPQAAAVLLGRDLAVRVL